MAKQSWSRRSSGVCAPGASWCHGHPPCWWGPASVDGAVGGSPLQKPSQLVSDAALWALHHACALRRSTFLSLLSLSAVLWVARREEVGAYAKMWWWLPAPCLTGDMGYSPVSNRGKELPCSKCLCPLWDNPCSPLKHPSTSQICFGHVLR